MGIGGFLTAAISGGMQGYGKGIENEAIARRNEALEAMRAQRSKEQNDANNLAADRRNERNIEATSKLEDQRSGNRIKEGSAQGEIEMGKLKFQAASARELEVLRSNHDIIEAKAKAAIDANDVQTTFRGGDGNMYVVTKGGKTLDTGIQAAPNATSAAEGGRLTDAEQETAYTEAKAAWREGGKKGAEPKKSDYIGMSREDYSTTRGGGKPTLAAPADAPKVVPPAEWDSIKAQAGQLLGKKDPKFRKPDGSWMTADEAIAMMRANLIRAGYKVPNG